MPIQISKDRTYKTIMQAGNSLAVTGAAVVKLLSLDVYLRTATYVSSTVVTSSQVFGPYPRAVELRVTATAIGVSVLETDSLITQPITLASLPLASSVAVGTQAYTSDAGLQVSDGLNWAAVGGGGGAVASVNSQTGVVVLTKTDVGLSNADNTSDAGKPVSTAQQTALDLKSNLASPTFTGTPAAPTASQGTNTTQLATAAHVFAGLATKQPLATTTTVASSRALTDADNGRQLECTAGSITLTIPDTLTAPFSCVVIPHASSTSLDPTGATVLNGAGTTLARTSVTAIIPLASTANSYLVTDPLPSLTGTAPELMFNETDEGTDEKLTQVLASGGAFSITTRTDANAAGRNILLATARTGITPGYVQLGDPNVPLYLFGSLLEFVVNAAQIGGEMFIYGTAPGVTHNDTNGGTDQKRWRALADGTGATTYRITTNTDSASPGRDAIAILRGTGVAIASLTYGNATDLPPHIFQGHITLTDGVTAPGTVAGQVSIYVDTADGDLKCRFGDGLVKTLATDT